MVKIHVYKEKLKKEWILLQNKLGAKGGEMNN